jgi:phosphate starvation-inducible membrane PsiE
LSLARPPGAERHFAGGVPVPCRAYLQVEPQRGLLMPTPAVRTAANAARQRVDSFGHFLVESFHLVGLFAIGAATVWAALIAFLGMVRKGGASVEDLLLLFIYLEIGAMVGIYFKTNHMPIRFLIYVAMTAVGRVMVGHVNLVHKPDMETLTGAAAILVLSLSVLIVRFASHRFPALRIDADVDEAERRSAADPAPKT